jgi:acyl dehydratase
VTAGRLLTDELRACIGKEVEYIAPEELGQASIRYYATALGDDNPLYHDADFAARTRFGGIVAPPTLVCETNQFYRKAPDELGYAGHLWDLPLPVPCRMIRGGNDYRFYEPVRPHDRIRVVWRLADIVERQTRMRGLVLFVTSEVSYYRLSDGALLATNVETNIYEPLEPVGADASGGSDG